MRVSSGIGVNLKTALITGASGAIGRATALKFAKEGFFVIAQYSSNTDGINLLIEDFNKADLSDNLFTVKFDLKNTEEIRLALEKIKASFRYIDVIVNNAGAGLYKLITETSDDEWDDLFAVNVKGAHLVCKAFIDGMIEKKAGKVVNVSSIWGAVGASMEVAYSASKAALIGYTKALAKELAPSGITVNCVCPGVIDTPMNARFSKEEMQELAFETPLGRLGTAQEVAELIYFLSSEKADFITGQVITVDGGFTA